MKSISEKAKRYDEALKKAKDFYKGYKQRDNQLYADDLESLFPELKESGDEKIRNFIANELACLRATDEKGSDRYKELTNAIAWLEKQGEYNPTWSKEDETGLADAMWAIKQARTIAKDENDMGNLWYAENWLKSLKDRVQPKPKQEWSEKDERMFKNTIALIETLEDYNKAPNGFGDVKFWLKSLKGRYTWRPSDKQMHYLSWIANVKLGDSMVEQEVSKHLNELLEDLKKLKGK